MLYENAGVLAYVPEAARWPYEVHVTMRAHRASLRDCDGEELRLLADALQRVVRGFDALFQRPFPYVMAVHQAPTPAVAPDGGVAGGGAPGARVEGAASVAGGHLHVEFYPPLRTAEKLKYLAGSEQGAGVFISDVLPEDSAAELREAIARGA
jgi:UDPglucose--hexose-1-phosphate uridylyltransferase